MVKFSLFSVLECPPGRSARDVYREYADLCVYAESVGFHGAWVAEHHFSEYGTLGGPPVFLSSLAARTSKMRLGAAISVLPFHDPIRIAEDYAVVDVISDGRLEFGAGRGYQPAEFAGFGVDMAEARGRFLESLEIVKQAWYGGTVDHSGTFYTYKGIDVRPKPVQRRIPTYVASISPETFEMASQWGYGIMASLLTNSAKQINQGLSNFRASLPVQRRYAQPIPILAPVYVADSMDAAFKDSMPGCQWYWETVGKLLPKKGEKMDASYHYFQKLGEKTGGGSDDLVRTMSRWPIGDADYVAAFLTDLCLKSTADEIICFASLGAMPYAQARANVERIARDVMPKLRRNLEAERKLAETA
ncbi:MAG: LLM class flavin-dependent oxidoreductase [Alphaproteobacteria bacterium]